jgi:hypothetical protein
MNNAYRFFAPNPGSPTIMWFRIQYQDRSVRWVETPGPANSWMRAAYQRRLNLSMQPSQQVVPVDNEAGSFGLTPLGEICLSSYARHMANSYRRLDANGNTVGVRSVGIYFAQHASRSPAQVRAGWEASDLRTYQFVFAGAYLPDGQRVDEFRPLLKEQGAAFVVAGILEVDVYPALSKQQGNDAFALIDGLTLPAPICRLLARYPELADPTQSGNGLKERVQQLVGAP